MKSRGRNERVMQQTVYASVAGGIALLLLACHDLPSAPSPSAGDVNAGQWQTWLLASGAELRPAPPAAGGSREATGEIEAVLIAQRTRTSAMAREIARWNPSATAPWDSVALHVLDFYFPLLPEVRVATPVRAARAMALLHVAMYDAMVATWDAKYAYARHSPASADSRVVALAETDGVPSYPSEHAAVAAAAAAVLSALFPAEDTLAFHEMEGGASASRVAAGVAYPSDVVAGTAIGRAVAARALARARTDGASGDASSVTPSGAGLWLPTPNKFVRTPFDARAGTWRTWVLRSGDEYRLPPPPAIGSAAFARDVAELRNLSTTRTLQQVESARRWATDAPSVIWEKDMLTEIARRHLGPVSAARAQALASVAMYDAFIACWDAKFTYWRARPVSMDTAIHTVFPTPPFPSFPSGHSTISSAAAEVFADIFPDAATHYRDRALDASLSRIYAGVHYRADVESGESLGVRVGRAVVLRARSDRPSR